MSRLTISVSLASMILALGIPEQNADACGVKLAIKTTRQRARAKQNPVDAADRTVVASRAARAPVAVGPGAPRFTVKTKTADPEPAKPAAGTAVARVDTPPAPPAGKAAPPPVLKEPVAKEPVKAPATTVARTEPTPATKDATKAAPPVTVAKADSPPPATAPTKVAEEPPRKKKKRPTVATATTKQVEPAKPETPAVLDTEVYYGIGSTMSDDTANLDSAVKWLSANPTVHATIEGYADPVGWPDRNMMISRMRADAAFKYLVNHGIDGLRLEVQAFGDTKLKYDRDDIRNRRVAVEAKR